MASDPIFEHLPMLLNLGDFGSVESVVGFASASKDQETGKIAITIDLDEEISKQLTNLQSIFDLKAIGFAGIAKNPRRAHVFGSGASARVCYCPVGQNHI